MKKYLIGTIVFIAVIIFIVFCRYVSITRETKEESNLESKLTALGSDFYENYYYDLLGTNSSEKLQNASIYSSSGIVVNLNEILNYVDDPDSIKSSFINYKTGDSCDYTNTTITIYPTSPYSKTDYTISTTLVCGFNK